MLFPARRFKRNLWAGIVFFVKIVEMLGCFGDFEVQQECRGGSRPDRRKALSRRLQDEWQDKLKMQKISVIVLYIS